MMKAYLISLKFGLLLAQVSCGNVASTEKRGGKGTELKMVGFSKRPIRLQAVTKSGARVDYEIVHEVLMFNPRRANVSGFHWSGCSDELVAGMRTEGVTGASRFNGLSGQACVTNRDCNYDLNTKLKCYRPLCTCQKARLQVDSRAKNTVRNAVKLDYVGEFEASHSSLPEDADFVIRDGNVFWKVPFS